MLDAFIDKRNTQSDHEKELFQQYFTLKNSHDLLREIKREMTLRAEKKTQV